MSIYCIADLHLSLNGSKSMEIFKGWEGYVEKLRDNWIKTVREEDTVVIAGDISWELKISEAYKDFSFLNELPGKKIIMRGNHDYWWSTATKVKKFFEESEFKSLSILFNSAIKCENKWVCGTRGWTNNPDRAENEKIYLREIERLKLSINKIDDDVCERIAFFHYPPVYGTNINSEIINILIEKNIKKCYYGHIHGVNTSKNVIEGLCRGIEFTLVSCDHVGFCPIFVA